MTYAPPKNKREYIGALWKKKRDGSRGDLLTHKCARCHVTHDSERNGTWFERADSSGLWRWVCYGCLGNHANITQKSREYPAESGMDARLAVSKIDHPDIAGGIVWSDCEIEWICAYGERCFNHGCAKGLEAGKILFDSGQRDLRADQQFNQALNEGDGSYRP